MKKYRHELKYTVNTFQIETIKNTLLHLMNVDKNIESISNKHTFEKGLPKETTLSGKHKLIVVE